MQANGERVVTIFITQSELGSEHRSKLVYMDGEKEHSKDPLEFTLHDLKHMELFCDPQSHLEQVGFFICFLRTAERPRKFFMEHVGNFFLFMVCH